METVGFIVVYQNWMFLRQINSFSPLFQVRWKDILLFLAMLGLLCMLHPGMGPTHCLTSLPKDAAGEVSCLVKDPKGLLSGF